MSLNAPTLALNARTKSSDQLFIGPVYLYVSRQCCIQYVYQLTITATMGPAAFLSVIWFLLTAAAATTCVGILQQRLPTLKSPFDYILSLSLSLYSLQLAL